MIEFDLRKHLEECGLRCLTYDEQMAWGNEILNKRFNKKNWEKFELLASKVLNSTKKSDERLAFYDLIAEKNVEYVLHSQKFNAILKSGLKVSQLIDELKPISILDFGCNTGHLTSWYARSHQKLSITGVDISYHSIQVAKNLSNKFGLKNCNFLEGNYQKKIDKKFDIVVDTQSIFEVTDRKKILRWISNSILNENGTLISIPQTGNKEDFLSFVGEITSAGLHISSLEFISFEDLDQKGCYPVICAKSSKIDFKYDLDLFWDELYNYFSSS